MGEWAPTGAPHQRPYIREMMHSALNPIGCSSGHPLSQLLGEAAVSVIAISLRSTAAPLSSWDKGCLDKDHIGNV